MNWSDFLTSGTDTSQTYMGIDISSLYPTTYTGWYRREGEEWKTFKHEVNAKYGKDSLKFKEDINWRKKVEEIKDEYKLR